ncbi:alkyl hydroperoxide reductase/ Thiol specific antioxidant/ Mal allergen [Hymenobacter roseosalivarius DSM 11622]|uniref:Thioredoxin peroxidase n=1 Tax=Hymenobacter roseosalivarius DSM 11622 TaxID=645990 RepID=A0A1W1W3X4_9BACT|nr:peroxiredoxin [Hymenobacter roseosalivarius]SMC00296.1 alkyl hydroperoxide reductase/ Thiol specific antioxidant/ Mal allergen [Hymenobacter roseosalivarius DSM 11622]
MAVLVGKRAPSFKATAVIDGEFEEEFSLDRYLGKKHVIFFFYPADFTFVCPTEILAFQDKLADFEAKAVAVVGCSTDTHFSHSAWLNTSRVNGGIEGVTYPLVADATKTIAANYDVLGGRYDYNEAGEMTFVGSPLAYRALFLIDKDGIVRHQLINDGPLGRNIDEALRMVSALQYYEVKGEECPANWAESEQGVFATRVGVFDHLTKQGITH